MARVDRNAVFLWADFSAVVNGAIWGNGLCRSADTNPQSGSRQALDHRRCIAETSQLAGHFRWWRIRTTEGEAGSLQTAHVDPVWRARYRIRPIPGRPQYGRRSAAFVVSARLRQRSYKIKEGEERIVYEVVVDGTDASRGMVYPDPAGTTRSLSPATSRNSRP